MSRRRLSFTERRRARLALKFGRLDRLETRNTMTEPISATAISTGMLRSLAQFGIMQADGGNSALLGLAQMAHQAKIGAERSRARAGSFSTTSRRSPSVRRSPARRGRRAAAVPCRGSLTRPWRKPAEPIDWLPLTSLMGSVPPQSGGISMPWHPASRAGGGAAMAPRGGSGNGAQAATVR